MLSLLLGGVNLIYTTFIGQCQQLHSNTTTSHSVIQTVWATSSEVGCGAYRCASGAVNFKYKNALILVCDYGPG